MKPDPGMLEGKIRTLLNQTSQENESHTPDHILANYLIMCLDTWNKACQARDAWWGFTPWKGKEALRVDDPM